MATFTLELNSLYSNVT